MVKVEPGNTAEPSTTIDLVFTPKVCVPRKQSPLILDDVYGHELSKNNNVSLRTVH